MQAVHGMPRLNKPSERTATIWSICDGFVLPAAMLDQSNNVATFSYRQMDLGKALESRNGPPLRT